MIYYTNIKLYFLSHKNTTNKNKKDINDKNKNN